MRSSKYLVLSDVHLGHRRTSTKFILNNLYTLFDRFGPKCRFRDVKVIFVAGDLFDRLMDHTGKEYVEVLVFISKLFLFALSHGIKVRFLEGTPSHDWRQYGLLRPMASLIEQGLDFKYVDTLEIEYMEDLGINVLYVPDEYRENAATTLKEVKELMAAKGLEKVTIAIMHGMFHYQVAGIPLKDSVKAAIHDEEAYLAIVDRWINIGHVHTSSFFERIVAQGSTDRISHGEEGPKVVALMEIYEDRSMDRFTFIENKGAKIYKTVNVEKMGPEEAMAFFDKETSGLPTDSHVRVVAEKANAMIQGLRELSIARPQFVITAKTVEEIAEEGNLILTKTVIDNSYAPISITRDNVTKLIVDGVSEKVRLLPNDLTKLQSLLEECHVR